MNAKAGIIKICCVAVLLLIIVSCSKSESTSPAEPEIIQEQAPSTDSVLFLSTQLNPIEEANKMRTIILTGFSDDVDFRPNDNNSIFNLIPYEMETNPDRQILFGGLHGDFYTLLDRDLIERQDVLDVIEKGILKEKEVKYLEDKGVLTAEGSKEKAH